MERKQLQDDEERQALLDESVNSSKRGGGPQAVSLSSKFQEGRRPTKGDKDPYSINNKHEALYCCGRRGVNFLILNTAQFVFILTILFISLKSCTLDKEIAEVKGDSTKTAVHSVLGVFALFIILYIWFISLPGILFSYAVTSNIEMMKNKDCMHKVIQI